MCSRAGYQAATMLRQPTIYIQITDTGRIVKNAFFFEKAQFLGYKIHPGFLKALGDASGREW